MVFEFGRGGNCPQKLTYEGIIERTLLYGCEVWVTNVAHTKSQRPNLTYSASKMSPTFNIVR